MRKPDDSFPIVISVCVVQKYFVLQTVLPYVIGKDREGILCIDRGLIEQLYGIQHLEI